MVDWRISKLGTHAHGPIYQMTSLPSFPFTRRLGSELQRALSQRGFQSPAPASLGAAPRLLLSVTAFALLAGLLYANSGICQVLPSAIRGC
jgi:hypothetical protein